MIFTLRNFAKISFKSWYNGSEPRIHDKYNKCLWNKQQVE